MVGGGPEPRPEALRPLFEQANVIAADGGWRLCQALGVTPALLVGDMDTLTTEELEQAEAAGSLIARHPTDKDQSDLELAIEAAYERGARRITLVGALGGQWDHCLANLLAPLSRCRELDIWARLVTHTAEIYLLEPGEYLAEAQPGTRVSLAALTPEVSGLSLDGFKYPLDRSSLRRSQTRGLANSLTQTSAFISLGLGDLLLTFQHKTLDESCVD